MNDHLMGWFFSYIREIDFLIILKVRVLFQVCLNMNKEKFVPVFIDGKPPEVLNLGLSGYQCLVGLTSNNMKGVEGLRPYKKTTPKKRKMSSVDKIIQSFDKGDIQVDVVGVAGKPKGSFIQNSTNLINKNKEKLGGRWIVNEHGAPKSFYCGGHKYPIANLLGLCLYAEMLPIIALRLESRVYRKKDEVISIKLCLDRLPHNSEKGLELMNRLSALDEGIQAMWNENMSRKAQYVYGVLDQFEDPQGVMTEGKNHPCSILIDWFAAFCLAKVNPEQIQQEGGYTSQEVDELASIWDLMGRLEGCSSYLLNVDDPVLINKVNEFNFK